MPANLKSMALQGLARIRIYCANATLKFLSFHSLLLYAWPTCL